MTVQVEKVTTVMTWRDEIAKSLLSITIYIMMTAHPSYTLMIVEMSIGTGTHDRHSRKGVRTNQSTQFWNKSIRELKDSQIRVNIIEVKKSYTTHQRSKIKSQISWLISIHSNFTSFKWLDYAKINKSWGLKKKSSKSRKN